MGRKNTRDFEFKTLLAKTAEYDVNGNVICYPELIETTRYELLQLLPFNRDIVPTHVQRMAASIQKTGNVLREVIVVRINFEYFVADGQHLNFALQQLHLPVRCKLIDAKNEEEALSIVTILNSTSRNWGIKNFVEGWANFNKDVKTLMKLKKDFSLTYTTIGALLVNGTSTLAKKTIANGTFKIADKDEAIARIAAIDNFYNNTGFVRSQYATTSLIDFMGCLGIEKYYKVQNNFIKKVKAEMSDTKFNGKTYGRQVDYLEFFNRAWSRK